MTEKTYENSAEDLAGQEEASASAPETEIGGETAPADAAVRLEADLAAVKTEAKEWQDRFLRKAAEMENYRKRMERERGESAVQAKIGVLREFLPLVDAFERAMESFGDAQGDSPGLDSFREGVELLSKKLSNILAQAGVVRIEAAGQAFDPHLHEALIREENSEYEENTVIRELRRGYLYKDRLLRPVQVIVATHPQGEDTEN